MSHKLAFSLLLVCLLSVVSHCAQGMTLNENGLQQQQRELLGGNKRGTACNICKYMLNYVENMVINNKTVVEVTTVCWKLCGLIPGEFKYACQGFVSYFVPFMMAAFVADSPPDQVCADIGVCSRPTFVFAASLNNNEQCGMCEAVTTFTQAHLKGENGNLNELHAALEELCLLVPNPTQCYAVVDQHFVSIYMSLSSKLSPREACKDIGLCLP
ncbi:hypothetical protein QOT17_015663 [Balamuthia mandrillaris]